jgi:hypothetical protein
MKKIKIGDETYTIKYGYRTLCKTNALDRLQEVQEFSKGVSEQTAIGKLKKFLEVTADLFLVGAQKYHEEFRFETEDEREEKLDMVYDLLDQLADDDDGAENAEDKYGIMDLFADLTNELADRGFLSQIFGTTADVAKEKDATVIPQDHKKPTKK